MPRGNFRFAEASGDILFNDRKDTAGQCAVLGQELRGRSLLSNREYCGAKPKVAGLWRILLVCLIKTSLPARVPPGYAEARQPTRGWRGRRGVRRIENFLIQCMMRQRMRWACGAMGAKP